jgi:hypothetical protein
MRLLMRLVEAKCTIDGVAEDSCWCFLRSFLLLPDDSLATPRLCRLSLSLRAPYRLWSQPYALLYGVFESPREESKVPDTVNARLIWNPTETCHW